MYQAFFCANTKIDKVTDPVLKRLIIYTHIFHKKKYKNV